MAVPTQYQGFTPGYDRAKLMSITLTSPGVMMFNYNPEKIRIKRDADTKSKGTKDGGRVLKSNQQTTITIDDIVLEGLDTKARCDMLLNWTGPGMLSKLAAAFEIVSATKMPVLMFQWGPPAAGFFYRVNLMNVSVDYERFTPMGLPVRAKVSLTLREKFNPLGTLPTNPSSGGLSGRSTHMVREGDNLVQVTTDNYGHPKHWRELANANGIDDPLRVKPGQALYLPNPNEFADGPYRTED